MKRKTRLIILQLVAVGAILSFGLQAHAETPREELVHAYYLVKTANKDYGSHRGSALHAMEGAAKGLGMKLEGGVPSKEAQWKSDDQMREALRLLREARDKMEEKDRNRIVEHLDNAIKDIDVALSKR
jgi:hypothetical protein